MDPNAYSRSVFAQVQGDFNLSFFVVQGNQGRQPDFFALTAADYAAHMTAAEQADLAASLPALGRSVLRLELPRGHTPLGDKPAEATSLRQNELATRWTQFESYLTPPKPIEPGSAAYIRRIGSLAANTLKSDIWYLFRGRPTGTQEPYESHFRKYALLGADTGSAAVNRIMGAMREHSLSRPDFRALALARRAWEARHPDEQYLPEVYKIALDARVGASRLMRTKRWLGERLASLSVTYHGAMFDIIGRTPDRE